MNGRQLDPAIPARYAADAEALGFPLTRILDGISEAICVLDREWRYTYVNAPAEVLTGKTEAELIGRSIWELFPGALGTSFETYARRAVEEQRPTTLEYFFPTFNRWYEHRFHPTADGLLFFTTDIDERKQLEERVRDGAERYRQLFEVTQDGILIVDDQGLYVDVNPSLCRILNGSREAIVGAHFSRFIPADRLREASDAFASLKAGNPTPIEFPLRTLDGSIVDLEWTSAAHYLPHLSFCVCRDISERRRTQAALAESQERQRRAAEAGNVGLWEWDIETNSVTWSDYIYELHGLERGTFGGTVESFAGLIDPRDKERVEQALAQCLAGRGDYHVEFRPLRPDGQTRWLTTTGKVTFAGDGRPLRMHGAVSDTTLRKTAEEAQAAIERELLLLIDGSSALLASPHSHEVLRTIVALAQRFVAADAHAVWRKHPDNTWRLASSEGLSDEYVTAGMISAAGVPEMPAHPLSVADIATEPLIAQRSAALLTEGVRSILSIPLNLHGATAGTLVFYWRVRHECSEGEVRVAASLGNLAASALGTAELYDRQLELRTAAEAASRRAAFLVETGAVLASSLDHEATLISVAHLAVPSFADWASVDILDDQENLRRVAIHHSNPDKVRFAREFVQRYPPREEDLALAVLRTGTAVLLEEISDAVIAQTARDAHHLHLLQELGLKSAIVVPMVVNGRSRGIITFVTAESGRRYTAADLQTAEELARRAATALEHARLYHESQRVRNELHRANIDLRRANEDLNQFAYSASHDLKEPLRMIALYTQLLQKNYGAALDATARIYLGYTLDGARRMEALIKGLLAYTQAGTDITREVTPVAVADALATARAHLATAIQETGAVIEHGALPTVLVHEIHLVQLLQNLIGNSLKYHSELVPHITITATPDPAGWQFAIRDNGIGFASEYKEKVFELFNRLHTAETYPGTGVGLAICEKIVERYGGRIWAESEPGRGTTFLFTLPGA